MLIISYPLDIFSIITAQPPIFQSNKNLVEKTSIKYNITSSSIRECMIASNNNGGGSISKVGRVESDSPAFLRCSKFRFVKTNERGFELR